VSRRAVGRLAVIRPRREWAAARAAGALVVLAAGCWWISAGPALAGPGQTAAGTHTAEVSGANSRPASGALAPGVQAGADGVTLLAQSPWVESGHDFHLQLQITAHDPAREYVDVQAFSRLETRTAFDEALTGDITGYADAPPVNLDLGKLTPDPAGGVDINIPVDAPSTSADIPAFQPASESGVYPLQISLYDDTTNAPEDQPLTTFLVYAAGPKSETQLPPLSVSLIVPVHAPPVVKSHGQLGSFGLDQSLSLANLVGTLGNFPNVKASLEVTPQTLDTLAGGSGLDRTTLNALAQLVQGGSDQVLPSTYAAVPLFGWEAAGLSDELTQQLTTGSSVLGGVFGVAPSPQTWVVNGPLDSSTLHALIAQGAKHFVVPDGELSPLPTYATETTFAIPAQLVGEGTSRAMVYGADVGLTADFSNPGGPVLAANQLLAELAMIQVETPGVPRGVAVLPPAGWSANTTFLDTLLAGLAGHPLLSSVTASGLFAAVPVPPGPQVQRSLVSPQAAATAPTVPPAPSSTATSSSTATTIPPAVSAATANQSAVASANEVALDAGTIRSTRLRLDGLAAVLPQDAHQTVALGRALLTAESSDITEGQRQALLSTVSTEANRAISQITLPGGSSITLTSTTGQIPLTVLAPPTLHARVQLRLSSQRLIFRLFSPPGGKCQVPTPTSEVCDLTLTTQNTTLKVPVETRASGVFPLDVSLWTPDGSVQLASDSDTVRSTAVSGVGVVLIVLAIVSLAVWWVRDLRHGRRARQLVPAPGDETSDEEDAYQGEEGAGEAAAPAAEPILVGEPGDSDPVVREFFSTPAPDYDDRR